MGTGPRAMCRIMEDLGAVLIDTLIFALATTRLTTLITQDEITKPFRDAADALAERHSSRSLNALVYLLNCRRCCSIWCALAVLLARRYRFTKSVALALAGSEATIVLLGLEDVLAGGND